MLEFGKQKQQQQKNWIKARKKYENNKNYVDENLSPARVIVRLERIKDKLTGSVVRAPFLLLDPPQTNQTSE